MVRSTHSSRLSGKSCAARGDPDAVRLAVIALAILEQHESSLTSSKAKRGINLWLTFRPQPRREVSEFLRALEC